VSIKLSFQSLRTHHPVLIQTFRFFPSEIRPDLINRFV